MLTGLLIVLRLIAAALVFLIKGKAARTAALGLSVIEFGLALC